MLKLIDNSTQLSKWEYCIQHNLTDELQSLIDSGFNKNTFDENGNNLLMIAIIKQNKVLFDFAMKNKISIYQKNLVAGNALSETCYPYCSTDLFIQIWQLIKPHNVDNIISGLKYDLSLDIYDNTPFDLSIGMCFHRLLRDKVNFDKIKWLIPKTTEQFMKENIEIWTKWARFCGFEEAIPYINRNVLTFDKLINQNINKDFIKNKIIKI